MTESKAACCPWIRNQLPVIMTNEAHGLAYRTHHEQISLLSKRRGPALASMSGFVRMCVCSVEIDRWSGGQRVRC